MPGQSPEHQLLLTQLATLKASNASKVATKGSLAPRFVEAGGSGVVPGRVVYDTVTGQFVEVIGVGTATLPPAPEGEKASG